MFMQQLRWLLTLLWFRFRSNTTVTCIPENHVMEHTYSTHDAKQGYRIRVVEQVYVVNSGKSWWPNRTRRVYQATLTHTRDSEVVCVFTNTYPHLSNHLIALCVDKAYTLAEVADLHLKKYLED